MIDQQRINNNSSVLHQALVEKKETAVPGLYTITRPFDQDLLDAISAYLETCDYSTWEKVYWQEDLARKKKTWDTDTVVEELHCIFETLTDMINREFPGPHKHFWGVSIWADSPGYFLKTHTDNPDIDVSLQVYLFDDNKTGTRFFVGDKEILIPGDHNTGYILSQTASGEQIPHRLDRPIPDGPNRISLYAVWSRFPKYLPDTQ